MFILRIWNYFRGYAIIIVEGLKIERFINLSTVNNIYIWDIKKTDYNTISAKVGVSDFLRLKEIVRKSGSSVKIHKKCGFPFALRYAKRRKGLLIGFFSIVVFLCFITSYIWMIEIVGLKDIDKEKVIKCLYEEGLREGVLKYGLDNRDIENRVLIKLPELSWVGIKIRGTKVYVEVVEKRPEPSIIKSDEPCNVVADKCGIISKINVLLGDGMVKCGDTVAKGQILVRGEIIRENLPLRYVHSLAEITARTWYEEAEEFPLKQIEYIKTGRKKDYYSLILLNNQILSDKKAPYDEYSKDVEGRNLLSFGDYVFPIKLIKTTYSELIINDKCYTIEDAKDRCKKRLETKVKVMIPENSVIVDKKFEFYEEKDILKAKISVEVLENIGKKEKINN